MSLSLVFIVETFSLFVSTHGSSMYMYSCICVVAISVPGCCEPIVPMPMARGFNETVSMDLKVFDGVYFLVLVELSECWVDYRRIGIV